MARVLAWFLTCSYLFLVADKKGRQERLLSFEKSFLSLDGPFLSFEVRPLTVSFRGVGARKNCRPQKKMAAEFVTDLSAGQPSRLVGLRYGYPMLAWPLSDPLCLGLGLTSLLLSALVAAIMSDPEGFTGCSWRMQPSYARNEV